MSSECALLCLKTWRFKYQYRCGVKVATLSETLNAPKPPAELDSLAFLMTWIITAGKDCQSKSESRCGEVVLQAAREAFSVVGGALSFRHLKPEASP